MPTLEFKPTRKAVAEGFKRRWLPLTKMDDPLDAKVKKCQPVAAEVRRLKLNAWRKELHRDFERALAETRLPERLNYEKANEFLIKARRQQAK